MSVDRHHIPWFIYNSNYRLQSQFLSPSISQYQSHGVYIFIMHKYMCVYLQRWFDIILVDFDLTYLSGFNGKKWVSHLMQLKPNANLEYNQMWTNCFELKVYSHASTCMGLLPKQYEERKFHHRNFNRFHSYLLFGRKTNIFDIIFMA